MSNVTLLLDEKIVPDVLQLTNKVPSVTVAFWVRNTRVLLCIENIEAIDELTAALWRARQCLVTQVEREHCES